MKLIDERTIYGIGEGRCLIFQAEDDSEFIVEVENNVGSTAVSIEDEIEAWRTFMHPLDGKHGLTIPAPKVEDERGAAYHAAYAAIELAEAGDSDAV